MSKMALLIMLLLGQTGQAMCAKHIGGHDPLEPIDLKSIAQWLLHDSRMGEHHALIYKRIQANKRVWNLNDTELDELAQLVTLTDVQFMLYQGHEKAIPDWLLGKARKILDQAYRVFQSTSSVIDVYRAVSNGSLSWNPNENWEGTKIELDFSSEFLGAIWVIASAGNDENDLTRIERLMPVYDFPKEQLAAIMAQRQFAQRLGKKSRSPEESAYFRWLVSTPTEDRQRKDYIRMFNDNVAHSYPFTAYGDFSSEAIVSYLAMVRGLITARRILSPYERLGPFSGR